MAKQDILIKQAKDLIGDMKAARSSFIKKTSMIISDADKTAKVLSKVDLDKELGKVGKTAVEKMDAIVLDFLSEDDVNNHP